MPSYPKAENAERYKRILELRAQGLTYKDIAQELGDRSISWVANYCRENNLRHTARDVRLEKYREYKRQGRTAAEVAERFGISRNTAAEACRGIAPQRAEWARNQYTAGTGSLEEYMETVIERYMPIFEYAGGYTGHDGFVDIRCKTCGCMQTRSLTAIRHRKIECTNCRETAAQQREEARAQEQERQRAERKAERDKRREEQEAAKAEERAAKLEARRHYCPVCGKETTRGKYCSTACAMRQKDAIKSIKRRAKIEKAMVDKDITLWRLSRRDHGICYLCGGKVDWKDKEERDGVMICGGQYPSIDHVLPLAKGGAHSWDNVKLAHRICNTRKSDSLIPLSNFEGYVV